MHFFRPTPRAQRGSALATVLMLAMGFMIIVASTLTYSLTERRLNHREAMRLEARNAAEAISEYGLSQVRQKMEDRSDFTSTRFTSAAAGSANAVGLPSSTFWGGSLVSSGSQELVIGLITPVVTSSASSLYYYDPTDLNNAYDTLRGRYAFRFDIRVLSKATVTPPTTAAGGPQTCYMTQTLSARASPLFSHAIFYNMDLEIAPGPTMNILGGVHTNGDLWVKKQSSNGRALNFVGPVTAAGGLYAGVKCAVQNTNGTLDDFSGYTDNVYFSTAAGGLVGLKNSSTSVWRDQKWGQATETSTTQTSFRTWASQTFGGNLMTELHGVQICNPPGLSTYVPDPTPANGVDNSINDAHKIIEPPIPTTDTANYNAEVEAQKYSTRAGIYICANPSNTTRNGRKPDGTTISIPALKYRVFTRNGIEITLPGQTTYGTNNATANTNANAGGPPVVTIRPNAMYDNRRATHSATQNYSYSTSRSSSNSYNPRQITLIDIDMAALKLAVDKTFNGLTSSTGYLTAVPANGTATSAAAWTNFIYNPGATPSTTLALTNNHNIIDTTASIALTSSYWNGAIYIESIDACENPGTVNYRQGLLSSGPSGVRLINGRGRVASDTTGTGLTIATNDALYILGHFNADGSIDTATSGTTNSGRYNETGETPVSVVCDSMCVLSAPAYSLSGSPTVLAQTIGWNDGLSRMRTSSSGSIATWKTSAMSSSNAREGDGATSPADGIAYRVPYDITSTALVTGRSQQYGGNDTEISSAVLAGIVISNKDANNQFSGGAHNYPRFLEDFAVTGTQKILAIRGSFVAMFECRASREPYNWRTYSNAPNRLWGFNELFNQGRFPPLTPRVMSYRRVDFNDIDRTTYNSVKASWGL